MLNFSNIAWFPSNSVRVGLNPDVVKVATLFVRVPFSGIELEIPSISFLEMAFDGLLAMMFFEFS